MRFPKNFEPLLFKENSYGSYGTEYSIVYDVGDGQDAEVKVIEKTDTEMVKVVNIKIYDDLGQIIGSDGALERVMCDIGKIGLMMAVINLIL